MSVVARVLTTVSLASDDLAFLRERAFPLWHEKDQFSEQDVERAKALFATAFAVQNGVELMGMRFEDALVMYPSEDRTQYFAMIVQEGKDGATTTTITTTWMQATVTVTNFEFVPENLGFREFLMILKTYEGRE